MYFFKRHDNIPIFFIVSPSQSDFFPDSLRIFLKQLRDFDNEIKIYYVKSGKNRLWSLPTFLLKLFPFIFYFKRTTIRVKQIRRFQSDSDLNFALLTIPYIENYEEALLTEIQRLRILYLGYGLSNIMDWDSGEFNLDFFGYVKKFLISTDSERYGFETSGISSDKILRTGDPLIHELFLKPKSRYSVDTFLWAPHWTKNFYESPGWSNWHLQIRDVFDFAVSNPHINHIFRPHPFLYLDRFFGVSELPQYALEMWEGVNQSEKVILREYLSLNNVQLSCADLFTDLQNSAVLMTDGISILGYGLASGCKTGLSRRLDSPNLGVIGLQMANHCEVVMIDYAETSDFLKRAFKSLSSFDATPQIDFIRDTYKVSKQAPGEIFLRDVAIEIP